MNAQQPVAVFASAVLRASTAATVTKGKEEQGDHELL